VLYDLGLDREARKAALGHASDAASAVYEREAIDGPPLTELTILAEFFNPDFLREKNLPLPPWMQ